MKEKHQLVHKHQPET